MIRLTEPLAVLDLETTGPEPDTDRVVQVAVLRTEPSGAQSNFVTLVNPGCEIPPEATEVHGIGDADVKDAPTFREVVSNLSIILGGARWCGYNCIRFDVPLLMREYDRAGAKWPSPSGPTIDVFQLYQQLEPRTLGAVYQRLTGQEMDNAHEAMADVLATSRVLDLLVAGYEIEPTLEAIQARATPPPDAQFVDAERKFRWRFGEPVFTFGKCKGRSLREIARADQGYIRWALGQDFSEEFKDLLRDALDGRIPQRPTPSAAEQGTLV